MSSGYGRAAELFLRASALPEDERRAFLQRECANDTELLRQVLELLAHDADPFGPIPRDANEGDEGHHPSTSFVRKLSEQRPPAPRHRLVGEIDSGGQGAILRVWDKALGRQLAMKVILGQAKVDRTQETPTVDEKTLTRFLDEAQITGQLDHPGIVPVHELGVDDQDRVYFTMKLVKGQTLHAAFEAYRAGDADWNLTRLLGVVLRVCEAMAFAHDRGVIHRDLKPGNVMVGRFGEVYVMDWGLGRVLGKEDHRDIRLVVPGGPASKILTHRDDVESESDSELVTRDGQVVGTPSYMAPEQGRGDLELVGKRSDVYSVGAILYDLLAGRAPYQKVPRIGSHAVLALLLAGPPTPIAEKASAAPAELLSICEKAMAREPAERYADMAEMAEDLRAFLEGRVVAAHATGPLEELRKWVRRNRATAAGFGLAAAVAIVASLMLAVLASQRARALEELFVERFSDPVLARLRTPVPFLPSSVPDLEALTEKAEVMLASGARASADPPPAPAPLPDSAEDLPHSLQELHTFASGYARILAENRSELAAGVSSAERRTKLEHDVEVLEIESSFLRRRFFDELELHRLTESRAATDTGDERHALNLRLHELRSELPRIREGLQRARSLERVTLLDHEREWSECISSIEASPLYGGLRIRAQLGLVPLRQDPLSGLWEFHHVLSGEPPRPGPDDRWQVRPETGIVLVLIPGDPSYSLGVERGRSTPERDADPEAMLQEGPLRKVALAPYFLSKYELTQGQWLRLTGEMPSQHVAGFEYLSAPRITRSHPVENVSHDDLVQLRWWNLDVPTEAQWERAVRALGPAPYGYSDELASLQGTANVGDQAMAGSYANRHLLAPWSDGYLAHAPVDAFGPNGFGLFGTLGNVSEWMRDQHAEDLGGRVRRVEPRTGELVPAWGRSRSIRGASFKSVGPTTRISYRSGRPPTSRDDDLGVRPGMDLDP